jgi:O-antigen/teichoic acid export membrane protein
MAAGLKRLKSALPIALPAIIAFLSSNFVNAGNLGYNMIFSRLMGPALFGDLAVVLTIKLSILALLGASQMAVSQMIASAGTDQRKDIEAGVAQLSYVSFVVLSLLLPVVLLVVWKSDVSGVFGLKEPTVLLFVLLSLPFTAPLALVRGVVTGKIAMHRFAWSVNFEMAVRLVASVCAWMFGLGIAGVAGAFALSIVAGWWAIRKDMPARTPNASSSPVVRMIFMLSLPFAALQCAQVALLDGDILFAKIWLTAQDAGYAGLLGLVQRIQFFACFGLSAALLPTVAKAISEGRNGRAEAMPVGVIFLGVSLVLIVTALIAPKLVIVVLGGPSFAPAAPLLLPICAAAACFTLSYLLATFLVAIGDKTGIWLILAAVPVQATGLYFVTANADVDLGLSSLVMTKFSCQLVLAIILLAYAGSKIWVKQTRRAG